MNKHKVLKIITELDNVKDITATIERIVRDLDKTIPRNSKKVCKDKNEYRALKFLEKFDLVVETESNIFIRREDLVSKPSDYLKLTRGLISKNKTLNRQDDRYKYKIECKMNTKKSLSVNIKCVDKELGAYGDQHPYILTLNIQLKKSLKNPVDFIISKIYNLLLTRYKRLTEFGYCGIEDQWIVNPFKYIIDGFKNLTNYMKINSAETYSPLMNEMVIVNENFLNKSNIGLKVLKVIKKSEGELDTSYSLIKLEKSDIKTEAKYDSETAVVKKGLISSLGYDILLNGGKFEIVSDSISLLSLKKVNKESMLFILNESLHKDICKASSNISDMSIDVIYC